MTRLHVSMYRFIAFFMVVLTLILVFMGWQADRRSDALTELREATARVEEAAVHTEEVLVEILEAQRAPERIARDTRVTEALDQIELILELLCQIDDPTRQIACANMQDGGTP